MIETKLPPSSLPALGTTHFGFCSEDPQPIYYDSVAAAVDVVRRKLEAEADRYTGSGVVTREHQADQKKLIERLREMETVDFRFTKYVVVGGVKYSVELIVTYTMRIGNNFVKIVKQQLLPPTRCAVKDPVPNLQYMLDSNDCVVEEQIHLAPACIVYNSMPEGVSRVLSTLLCEAEKYTKRLINNVDNMEKHAPLLNHINRVGVAVYAFNQSFQVNHITYMGTLLVAYENTTSQEVRVANIAFDHTTISPYMVPMIEDEWESGKAGRSLQHTCPDADATERLRLAMCKPSMIHRARIKLAEWLTPK